MKVWLIGGGCGPATLTLEAKRAIDGAELLLGSRRLLADYPGRRTIPAYRPEALLALLEREGPERACVLYSGDTGFYSGALGLLPLLAERNIEYCLLPGISSLQVLSARVGRPWQDWRLCSAHGVALDPIPPVMEGRPTLFLTAGAQGPGQLCARLTEAGLGELPVTVGENLGLPGERICRDKASSVAGQTFGKLNLLLTDPAPVCPPRTPGIPDGEFLRGQIPMTKQEVRSPILSKLAVGPEDLCWDLGAGTGSVSVELAHHSRGVWAVEQKAEALALIRENRSRFRAWNLRVVEGHAPEILEDLPAPDAVFVGGSGGRLPEILNAVHRANPAARVCVSANALETLTLAAESLNALNYETEITQIAVSRTRAAGGLHLLLAQNPVFLITGVKPCAGS